MRDAIRLRHATLGDASLLLSWRNDIETRTSSHKIGIVPFNEHIVWLKATLSNHRRQLYIAEVEGKPVGTVRADFDHEDYELSWTVAPESRRQGFGKVMVCLLADQIGCPVQSDIKEGNNASVKIAQEAGMSLKYIEGGVMHWARGGRNRLDE